MKHATHLVILLALALSGHSTAGESAIRHVEKWEGPEDFSWLARSIKKAPEFKSQNPRYSIWVLGDGRDSVMTLVWDESEGTGKGYDTLYADTNFNGDLTEEGKRFFWKNPADPKKADAGRDFEHYKIENVKEAGGNKVFSFEFASSYHNDEFEYPSHFDVAWPGGSYTSNCLPGNLMIRWSKDLKSAPVYRLGGKLVCGINGKNPGESQGTWQSGQNVNVGYAGTLFGDAQSQIRAPLYPEAIFLRVLRKDGSTQEDILFTGGCGCAGSFSQQLLVPTRVPPGRHVLISRCKYPDVLGGRTEFFYPVEIENAEYGKELSDPAFKALSAKFHDGDVKFASLRRVSSAGEAQKGYAEESVIAAQTADNHMTQSNADGVFPEWANMGNERLLVIGLRKSDGYTPPNHGLLKFDLSGVPKEAKILGAQVRLTLVNTDQYSSTQAGAVLEAYALRRNWLEVPSAANAYSCWLGPESIHNAKSGSVRWGKPGAEDPLTDRYPEAAGTVAIGEFPAKIDPANASKDAPRELRRLVALDITALAQKWHSGEVANHGLLLKMTGSASAMVASSEYPDYPFRPTLVLAYQGEPLKLVVKVAPDEDLDAARLKAASEKKPLLVKFYSPTCGICQKVQKTTFSDKDVKDLLAGKFSFVNLKIEDNAQLAQTLGVNSVPALVILAPDGKTKTGQIDSAQLQDSKVLIKALQQ